MDHTTTKSRWRVHVIIGVLGILVVPAIVSLTATTWDEAPDAAAYVHMTLANVASAVIAACTMVGLAIASWFSESRPYATYFTVVAVALVALAFSTAALAAASLVANIS